MGGTIRNKLPQLRVAGGFLAAALLIACKPASAANVILPGGTYEYAVIDSGRAASKSRIVVTRSSGKIVVGEHAEPMEATEVTRRTYDAANFAALSFADEVDGRTFTTVQITGNKAVVAQRERNTTLVASPGAPFAVFDAYAASFFQLPAMLHGVTTARLTLASLFLQYDATLLTASAAAAPRPPGVPARDASIAVTIDGKPGTLWYDPHTFVLDRFDLPSRRFSFVLKSYVDVVESLP